MELVTLREHANGMSLDEALRIVVSHRNIVDLPAQAKNIRKYVDYKLGGKPQQFNRNNVIDDFSRTAAVISFALDDFVVEHAKLRTPKETMRAMLESQPIFHAWVSISNVAREVFAKIKLEPSYELPHLQGFRQSSRTLVLLERNGTDYLFSIDNNSFTTTHFHLYADDLSQITLVSQSGTVLADFGWSIKNNRGFAGFSFYVGSYGANPYSITRYASYHTDSAKFAHFANVIDLFEARHNNDAAFLSMFENDAERMGFLSEARAFFKDTFPALAFNTGDGDEENSLDTVVGETKPKEINELACIDDEFEVELEALLLQEENRIRELRAKKKQQGSKSARGRSGRGRETVVQQDSRKMEREIEEARENVRSKVEKGRMKFRKIKSLINETITSKRVACRQQGSHIVLEAEGHNSITVVKLHGRRKTLSLNEVKDLIDHVATMNSIK